MTASVRAEYEQYGTPAALLANEALDKAEKIRLLEKWRDDEDALIRATAEGLDGGEASNLGDVLKALKKLKPAADLNNEV